MNLIIPEEYQFDIVIKSCEPVCVNGVPVEKQYIDDEEYEYYPYRYGNINFTALREALQIKAAKNLPKPRLYRDKDITDADFGLVWGSIPYAAVCGVHNLIYFEKSAGIINIIHSTPLDVVTRGNRTHNITERLTLLTEDLKDAQRENNIRKIVRIKQRIKSLNDIVR
ncbi:MAG: hypothetical protein WC916_07020 [Candidatus Woesearchaeota archaeon]